MKRAGNSRRAQQSATALGRAGGERSTAGETRVVVLCGNSLLLSAIAADLRSRTGLAIHQIEGSILEASRQLSAIGANVVIFDLVSSRSELTTVLLEALPDLLLVGVDLAGDRMLVLSGRRSTLMTTDDLVKVISPGNG